ncbi:hypothetical protein EDF56_104582 [Novosphingobium sp. PhB165]|uniref:hypothetical protein n=1 Tax=Novosphingobium sp. PhB165 TaxID=2485105 RepID=UPI0010479AA4|nr:hypothetical protein [Novosphingobium sp. PhB165]TCM19045.1 hypothetical protein EDF56_104582 [Novosphingobium sp. PhB165]
MGRKKQKMERFKTEHPTCYFCASNPTESEDHVPSRECFRGRVGPEGFSFPACKRCNNSAGNLEQVVALYLLLADQSNRDIDLAQLGRLVLGVKNNNPTLMPNVTQDVREARRHFASKQMVLAPGLTYSEVSLLQLPAEMTKPMELFTRRLTCALYYKEIGSPLPLEFDIGTAWLPIADPKSVEVAQAAMELFPDLRTTNRRNTDIGDQFTYVWGHRADSGLFGFTAQVAGAFLVFGACVPQGMADSVVRWKSHRVDVEMVEALAQA